MHRCRWFWLASSSLVGTLALSLAIPIIAQAAQSTSPVQHSPTQIFQKTGVAEGQCGNTVTFQFDVPSGKVLVVGNISARVFVPTGQRSAHRGSRRYASLTRSCRWIREGCEEDQGKAQHIIEFTSERDRLHGPALRAKR
jgi:hypothetical protein